MSSIADRVEKDLLVETRPWGIFTRFVHNRKCTVKLLVVNDGEMLSKQAHTKRDELWVIIDGHVSVELNEKIMYPAPGDQILILRNTKHRLASLGGKGRVLEIGFGDYDEYDIQRFADKYGRT